MRIYHLMVPIQDSCRYVVCEFLFLNAWKIVFFFLCSRAFFCISFTVILSKMWNIRVKSMIWRPFPLITRAIQIFHSSLSFVKRKLRPIVYQSHSQCIIVTFQEASSFANILWRFDNKKIPEKCSFIFL